MELEEAAGVSETDRHLEGRVISGNDGDRFIEIKCKRAT